MKTTAVFTKNIRCYNAGARLIANKGGARSSKTFSILQLLLLIALKSPKALLISVVSESFPHLKKGCLRDFCMILELEGMREGVDYTYNRTDSIFKVGKCSIEFFSADSPGKVHGPQRDILFINEANHISYEIYRQLAIRTAQTIFIDWNPAAEFWFEEEKLNLKPDTETLHSTYKDNGFLSPMQVREIESNKHNENWWRVYGLGLTGVYEGLIYSDWEQVNDVPAVVKSAWCGLDFGFTNDPTSLIYVALQSGELWIDELIYEPGLTNPAIANRAKGTAAKSLQIVADSAEPKSIAELKTFGLWMEDAKKGPDSILHGIEILQRYKWNVTSRSLNVIQELRNYQWKTDKQTGKQLNVPIDGFNHALDAIRYVALNKLDAAKPMRRRAPVGRLK